MACDEAYRQAEQQIERAQRKGATVLALEGMGLTEVPESLGNLTRLQLLDLSENQLTSLPKSLGNLAQLQELDLHTNQLTLLPESLSKLAQLRELNLFANKLATLPNWIGCLKSLQGLGVGANMLTDLPDSLSGLSLLVDLDLGDVAGGNPLGKLPTCIRSLNRLNQLYAPNVGWNRYLTGSTSLRSFIPLAWTTTT